MKVINSAFLQILRKECKLALQTGSDTYTRTHDQLGIPGPVC